MCYRCKAKIAAHHSFGKQNMLGERPFWTRHGSLFGLNTSFSVDRRSVKTVSQCFQSRLSVKAVKQRSPGPFVGKQQQQWPFKQTGYGNHRKSPEYSSCRRESLLNNVRVVRALRPYFCPAI